MGSQSDKSGEKTLTQAQQRELRLKRALRDNLGRRKQKARQTKVLNDKGADGPETETKDR